MWLGALRHRKISEFSILCVVMSWDALVAAKVASRSFPGPSSVAAKAAPSSSTVSLLSTSPVEMDPVTRGLLDELKGLLREELITLPKWREQVADVLREAEEQRQQSVNVSLSK